ncbi:hypothetical protein KUW10_10450 [Qipengyuania flava]|uniref:hypothetical protein n=2 Tax=Qipengyuania flava TaxID=192812 RepID=UPI001C56740C|nr:hypothetical protein [Qipengyuania flava]MBW3168760.1 hypothetical protein [Qipengyuania flava]MBY5965998.1 hypothetical protein [Qipengyuania flava]MBY6012322.1 hypothetical protein [Qipengyuania flava]MBY6026764.1 hypothetical protein [Qipengyuania flava]
MAGRMVCAIALGIPVLAGLAYLGLSGAPFVYIASNGLALVVALAATAFLRVRLSDRQCRILSVLLLLLLYVPLLTGPHVNGIARWLPMGPVALHAGALALPALVVLAARDDDYAPPILLAALLAASLQPDAATGLAVMLAAVGLYNATRDWRLVPVAGIAFLASIIAGLRGELPAQPFVERVLVDLALQQPLAALGLGASLLAAFVLFAHALPAEKPARHALAGSLFGFSLAAIVSNYPSVLIGYGAAPIIGYGLALALADQTPSG